MSIPTEGWRSLDDDAPRNGDIIVVKGHDWGKSSNPERVDFAHWSCDNRGENWAWRKVYRMGDGELWANAWMPYSEFLMLAQRPATAKPAVEFDL